MPIQKKTLRTMPKVFAFVLVAAIAAGAVIFCLMRNRSVDIEHYSFTETYNINNTFSVSESQNINEMLTHCCVENSDIYGFSSRKNTTADLYRACAALKLSTLIPDYDISNIKEKLSFLSSADINQFQFLDFMYYVDICTILNIPIDDHELNQALKKFYDNNANLFYLDGPDDTVNIKLIATAMVKNTLQDKLSADEFSPEEGIQQAYNDYPFLTQNDVTLYNSGGDILYCISVFGMEDIVDKKAVENWFQYWKDLYEGMEIDSQISAVQYSEYLNVAKVVDPAYSNKKLQDYYDSFNIESQEEFDDLNLWYTFMKKLDVSGNTALVSFLRTKIDEATKSDAFVSVQIDVQATAFGVMLAQKSGFQLNEEKLKKYVAQNYAKQFSEEKNYDRVANLYYTLILDQLLNNYQLDYDAAYWQTQIDETLNAMNYEPQTLAADVIATRRIVEIVADLQIFDVDVKLSNAQKTNIKKGMKTALQNSELSNTVLINEIYIVNQLLSLNIMTDDTLLTTYRSLCMDGGVRAADSDDILPDVNTTYQFFVSLSRMNHYSDLEQQKRFIDTLKQSDGIYAYDKNSEAYELSTIVYANALHDTELGGDKND